MYVDVDTYVYEHQVGQGYNATEIEHGKGGQNRRRRKRRKKKTTATMSASKQNSKHNKIKKTKHTNNTSNKKTRTYTNQQNNDKKGTHANTHTYAYTYTYITTTYQLQHHTWLYIHFLYMQAVWKKTRKKQEEQGAWGLNQHHWPSLKVHSIRNTYIHTQMNRCISRRGILERNSTRLYICTWYAHTQTRACCTPTYTHQRTASTSLYHNRIPCLATRQTTRWPACRHHLATPTSVLLM